MFSRKTPFVFLALMLALIFTPVVSAAPLPDSGPGDAFALLDHVPALFTPAIPETPALADLQVITWQVIVTQGGHSTTNNNNGNGASKVLSMGDPVTVDVYDSTHSYPPCVVKVKYHALKPVWTPDGRGGYTLGFDIIGEGLYFDLNLDYTDSDAVTFTVPTVQQAEYYRITVVVICPGSPNPIETTLTEFFGPLG